MAGYEDEYFYRKAQENAQLRLSKRKKNSIKNFLWGMLIVAVMLQIALITVKIAGG